MSVQNQISSTQFYLLYAIASPFANENRIFSLDFDVLLP